MGGRDDRRFHRLVILNLVVYLSLIGLGSTFHRDLRWAWQTLDAHLRTDRYPTTEDGALVDRAIRLSKEGADNVRVEQLLRRAAGVDRSGRAVLALAGFLESEGRTAGAHELFERYLSIDPWALPAYQAVIRIRTRHGDLQGAIQVATHGVEELRSRVALLQLRRDPAVSAEANDKAERTYMEALRSLRILEAYLAEVRQGSVPAGQRVEE